MTTGLQEKDAAGRDGSGDSKGGEKSLGVSDEKNGGTWPRVIEWTLPWWAKEGHLGRNKFQLVAD